MTCLFENYKRLPVNFVEGKGCWLSDDQGERYLDFLAGIAVSSLGHSHKNLVTALTDQVQKLLHVSNLYTIEAQEKAARLLVKNCGNQVLTKVLFCNSGAEANEGLIKMARRYAHGREMSPRITVTHNSFHGRTLATVSATGNPKYHEGFAPLMPGFDFVDYNDLEQAQRSLEESCAILLEPVQGEGGVVPADPAYLKGLESLCRDQKKLLLIDEVQTGIGRSGRWLASQHYQVQPDAVSLAKGLGGGLPVGAFMAREELAALLGPGSHGTTYGGNLLASVAVSAVLKTIEEEALLANVEKQSARLRQELQKLPKVREVRGVGLLLGVVLDGSADEVAAKCLEYKVLVNAVRPDVVRLAPPLVVNEAEVTHFLSIFERALK